MTQTMGRHPYLKRWLARLLAALAFGMLSVPAGAEEDCLEVGVFPYLTPGAILKLYQPLGAFLQKRLKRPVLLVTAPNHRIFLERTLRHEYPLLLTAPHYARLAQQQAGYLPLLVAGGAIQPVLVVAANGPDSVAGLKGRVVAIPDPLALVTLAGSDYLRRAGLRPGRDVTLRVMPSHSAALHAVAEGEVAAALTATLVLKTIPEAISARLRTLAEMPSQSSLVYLASPQWPPAEARVLAAALLEFAHHTSEGRGLMAASGQRELRPALESDLKAVEVFMPRLRELLKETR